LSFLSQLNPQQREAVETTEGPLLILAGAGSGKTRVITYRIAHLIENLGIMPESILAMTFTNKAAAEMGERVDKLVGGLSVAKPLISTFHSFCVRVLRRDIEALRVPSTQGRPPIGLTKQFVIYDEADQQQLVKSVMRRLGIDDKQITPRSVLAHISWAKNHMLDPQEVYLQSADPKTERVAQIYAEYKKELAKANAMDFDDLLLEAVRLLKAVPSVREHYNRRFQYILVDEYQDTNRPQYELMRLLAGTGHNVCAVGDEDQSIYSWRGADIRNILEFENDFPEAKIIRLEQNYRSTQNILKAASAVVSNNVKRKGKNLWTSRQGGTRIGYYEAPDGENEALFVADQIARYIREALERSENPHVAVLYRINSQSRLFEEAMRRYQLKYNVVGGFSFYERAEIKDMISYLKVIHNLDDSIALLRVINTPVRGIGKTTLETLERVALETGLSLWGAIGEVIQRQLLPQRALAALKSFRDLIEDARAMLAGAYVERLQETSGADQPTWGQAPSPVQPSEARQIYDGPDDQLAFDLASFDFGANVETESEVAVSPPFRKAVIQATADRNALKIAPISKSSENKISRLRKEIEDLKDEVSRLRLGGWSLLGILHHERGQTTCHDMFTARVPENLRAAPPECDHCRLKRNRVDTFVLQSEAEEIRQVGRKCLDKFLPGEDFSHYKRLSDRLIELTDEVERSTAPKVAEPPPRQKAVDLDSERTWDPSEYPEEENGTDDYRAMAAQGDSPTPPFRTPGGPATTAEILKFLIDRTGYIKQLEDEDTPEAYSRIENLRELVNAAMDSRDRGETLDQFLDHAALVSDADAYDDRAQVTLMTLHAAKGLEFPLVFLCGMEEGLFPHSRTFLQPDDIEEERRLCYVGMTRAMDTLILTRSVYRRRYGTDLPEASVPSRFLEEVPPGLIEELGLSRRSRVGTGLRPRLAERSTAAHYAYEDEDQSAAWTQETRRQHAASVRTYNSIDNIAEFFASRGKKFNLPKLPVEEPKGKKGFRPGQKVKHPKYGEGTVYQREGEGDEAKLTVQFPRFGLKKLVEKYAQLEKA